MKNTFVCLHFLSLGLITMINCNAAEKIPQRVEVKLLTAEYPLNKDSPPDSSQYSIQIEGASNVVKVNGKVMKSTIDISENKNKIQIKGEGNTVTVNQNDSTSEVIILQKGSNNHVSIIQDKK